MEHLSGAGGATLSALSTVSADLSIAVSLQASEELVQAAEEVGMRTDELIGIVLGLAVILSALQEFLSFVSAARHRSKLSEASVFIRRRVLEELPSATESKRKERYTELEALERDRIMSEKGLVELVLLFVSVFARISLSITIQLLAQSARARQTNRGARVVSLLALVCFFVFLQSFYQKR